IGVDEVAHQAVAVAVEVDSDELPLSIEDGAAGVPADGVRCRDEVERRVEIELVLAVEPALGQIERRVKILLPGPGEHSPEGRGIGELDAIDFVALHGAEREAKREGGVRGDGGAEFLESNLGNLGVGLSLYLFDQVEPLSNLTSIGVNPAGED